MVGAGLSCHGEGFVGEFVGVVGLRVAASTALACGLLRGASYSVVLRRSLAMLCEWLR